MNRRSPWMPCTSNTPPRSRSPGTNHPAMSAPSALEMRTTSACSQGGGGPTGWFAGIERYEPAPRTAVVAIATARATAHRVRAEMVMRSDRPIAGEVAERPRLGIVEDAEVQRAAVADQHDRVSPRKV